MHVQWDAYAKRAFPFVICVFLAAAAYFQARGVGALVGSEVQPPAAKVEAAAPAVRGALADAVDADPILERNPFSSEVDLKGGPVAAPQPVPIPEAGGGEDPNEVPKCDVGHVTLITGAEDPKWSFASISTSRGKGKLVRIGDEVSGHRVSRIGWKRVWLDDGGKSCVMKLGDKASAGKKRRAKRRPKRRRRRRRRGRSSKIPDEMAEKIHKVSDNEFEVERSVVDSILEKQAELMRHTRVRPMKRGDDIVGMRLSRVRNGTLLDTLGMKNGDVVKSINGFDLTDPQKALEAYGRLRGASSLKVQIERKGKPQTIEFNIQ